MIKKFSQVYKHLTLPMIFTYTRFILIPIIGLYILQAQWHYALIFFALAALTDVLDGALARFLNEQTALGAYLDPLGDKLLIITCLYCLYASNALHAQAMPLWFVVLVTIKEILLAVGALYLWFTKHKTIKATWAGKIAMSLEVIYVTIIMLALYAEYELSRTLLIFMQQSIVLCVIGSFIHYAYYGYDKTR